MNPVAAECARLVVGYLGLSDRIDVERGDALALGLPQAVLGISETFTAGFIREPGMEIIHRLAQRTRLVVPAIGKLFVRDFPTDPRLVTSHGKNQPNLILGRVTKIY